MDEGSTGVEIVREGKIIVTLGSEEKEYTLEQMSLDFDSSDTEIIEAMKPTFEEEGIALDGLSEMYVVKRMEDSGNIYIFPKSTMGNSSFQSLQRD